MVGIMEIDVCMGIMVIVLFKYYFPREVIPTRATDYARDIEKKNDRLLAKNQQLRERNAVLEARTEYR